MSSSGSLLLLLSLKNDPGTELDADGVPRLLRTEADRDAWRRLLLLLAQPDAIGDDSPIAESMVAAYLEGALSTNEAVLVEQRCWDDAAAMQELASIHRDHTEPMPEPTLSPQLQARLLSLGSAPATEDAPPKRVNGSPSKSAESVAAEQKSDANRPAPPPVSNDAATPPPVPPTPPPAPPARDGFELSELLQLRS